ncbi:MAG: ribosome biogenesis GTPase YlqF [Clostridia bacterium]|nr:ribosome biogenesis GTPase YlqF [Clostridia bacterium]
MGNNINNNINWFPGHMAKSIKKLKEITKFIDFFFEIVDARAPVSSRGDNFAKIIDFKPRIIVLNKSDLADEKITNNWLSYFKNLNIFAIKSSKNSSLNLKSQINNLINKLEIKKKFGKIRCAVIGVPNVGKSCFINRLLGNKKLKVENKAGVTRSLNWVSCGNLEICDTPGILAPKINSEFAKKISYLGLVKSEILNTEEIVLNLIADLSYNYKKSPEEFLKDFAISNGCISKGGEINLERASNLFLKNFQTGKLGKISLEAPN